MLNALRKLPDGKAISIPRRRSMIETIERERIAGEMPVDLLCRRAGVTPRFYRRLVTGERCGTARTLRKLAWALRSEDAERGAIERLYSLAFDAIMQKLLVNGDNAIIQARAKAIYIAHVELGLSQGRIADLAGVSKQFVGRIAQQLEDRRDDDPAFELTIARTLEPQFRRVSA